MSYYYKLLSREIKEDGTQVARYIPSINAQGTWNPKEQHMAPATGVICAELELFEPKEDMRYGRISLDILGMIHLDEFTITTTCIRPGRTIELVESVFESKGRTCIIARAWRMIMEDTSKVAGLEDTNMPSFENSPKWDGISIWPGGYIQSISKDMRIGSHQPGKGQIWLTNELNMLEGETTTTAFVKLLGMVDTMNGVAERQNGAFSHMFPNVDLQIHLYRMPKGKWLGLDVQQQYGTDGIGLTSAVLNDEQGTFGHAEQILTIREMPKQA